MERKVKRFLAVVVLVALSGCRSTTIIATRGYMPVIPRVDRPMLKKLEEKDLEAFKKLSQSAREVLLGNSDALMLYGKKQSISIEQYNQFAEQYNSFTKSIMEASLKGGQK